MSKMTTGWHWLLGIAIGSVYTLSANCVQAQITPDVTLPNNSIVTPSGNTINITGGTQAGTNLFHSFQEFSVRTGSGAFFNNNVDIQNIVSRVTGGSISNIDGLIRTLGTANLFLINPNGIVFGQNARLEIGGSFFASTASSLKFADGFEFRTNGTQTTPLLTISVPLGLQFGQNPGKIQVIGDGQGSRLTTATTDLIDTPNALRVGANQTLGLVGGDLEFLGGTLKSTGGRIELGSVGSESLVGLVPVANGWTLDYGGVQNFRDIQLLQGTTVDASGIGGGNVRVQGRQITLKQGSVIEASNLGLEFQSGGTLEVMGSESIQLDGSGATYPTRLASLVYPGANGKGGNINVTSGSVSLTNGAGVFTSTYGQGDAGSVFVQAKDSVSAAGNSYIFSNVEYGGVGKGGDVNINAATLSLKDGAQLGTFVREASSNLPAGKGEAGNVNVNVTQAVTIAGVNNGFPSGIFSYLGSGAIGKGGNINVTSGSVSLTDGAQILASTYGQGDAGSVFVQAKDSVSAAGNSYIFSNVEYGGVGKGGDVNINAATLSFKDSAQLGTIVREASSNLPAGEGQAGNVNVNVTGAVTIAGVKNGASSGIFSYLGSGAIGKGGNINITSGSLSLTDGAYLSASTAGQGDAGSILVQAKDSVSAAGNSIIFSNVEYGGVGKGGDVNINAATLSLKDGAQLSTSVREASSNLPAGQGQAGNVNVNVTGAVTIAGVKDGASSGIFSSLGSGAIGKGGNINVTSGSFSLTDGARLEASTAGQGEAGNVNVNVTGAVTIAGVKNGASSGIFSSLATGAIGKGGNINVTSSSFSLTDGAQLSASTFGQGDAGSILVQAKDSVSAAGISGIFSTVENGGVGKGGDVNINAATLSLKDGAQLGTFVRDASSNQPAGQGQAGNVNVNVTGAVMIAGVKNGASGIFSYLGSGAIGKGGNINVTSGSFSLTDGAQLSASTAGQGDAGSISVQAKDSVSAAGISGIFSTVENGGVGKGGDININAATLSLFDGAALGTFVRDASSTQPAGQGQAGDVNVKVTGAVTIDELASGIISSLGSGAIGKGGNINVTSGSVSLTDGARLEASTAGQGDAGSILVQAKDSVSAAGNSLIFSNVEYGGSGKGGDVNINAATLSLKDGAQLGTGVREASGNQPAGQGQAGNVNVNVTGAVTIAGVKNGPSGIFSSLGSGAIGKGGNINVTSGSFSLTDGAELTASTRGQGDAGKIQINATDYVSVSGTGEITNPETATGLFVNSQGSGAAGDIEVTAPQIRLDNGARFNAQSASGNGGNINLRVGDLLLLRRGSRISASAGTDKLGGNGGNITINARSGFIVSAPNENSDITANAFNGSGGKIDINSLGIFNFTQRSREDLVRELKTDNPNELNPQLLPTNDITAFSLTNPTLGGQITINTPDADQSLGLVELPTVLPDTSNLIANTGCDAIAATDSDTDKSKFTITGRGGLPPSPYEPLTTDVVWLDTRLSAITTQQQRSQGSAAKPPSKADVVEIVPATGWVFDGKGNVTLISHASKGNGLGSTPAGCSKK